jgi:hypothetical protein
VKRSGRFFLFLRLSIVGVYLLAPPVAQAGNQKEERLAASVRAALHSAVSDAPPTIAIGDADERERWLNEMSDRLSKYVSDQNVRTELLTAIHYEAIRAGLDPQLVLGLVHVESRFKKYALSKAGARGYMQVMPFWIDVIGNKEDNLFHMRTNLRYGCTILRHYIDLEKGNLYLALGRYNGSRGRAEYPGRVRKAWQKQWAWEPSQAPTRVAAAPQPVAQAESAPEKPADKASPATPQTVAVTLGSAGESPPVAQEPPKIAVAQIASIIKPPVPRTAARSSGRRDIVIVR